MILNNNTNNLETLILFAPAPYSLLLTAGFSASNAVRTQGRKLFGAMGRTFFVIQKPITARRVACCDEKPV